MSGRQKYLIWGSSGHAKVLADLMDTQQCELAVLFDNNSAACSIRSGVPLFIGHDSFIKWLADIDPKEYVGLIAIGGARGMDRLHIKRILNNQGIATPAIAHATAHISASATIGAATQILAHSLVSADSLIGEACIINHKASVDHECVLGNGVHLAPGVTLCGCIEIGDNAFVGAGSCILPRVKIGNNAIIGAGSVVTKNIPPGVIAYGNPARIVRDIRESDIPA